MKKIVVLISGRGSNLEAILRAVAEKKIPGEVVRVISNRADAQGLRFAQQHNIPATVIESRNYVDRDMFDAALTEAIDQDAPDLIVLAGFMRILGETFVKHFARRLINIHPSLLPSFPGVNTHHRVLQEGVKWHGCTVHFVTPSVDVGPIIGQAAVAVLPDDDEETLAARVLKCEHRLMVDCVRWFCEGRLVVSGNQVRVRNSQKRIFAQQLPID